MHNAPMLDRLVWGARGHATGWVAEKSTGFGAAIGVCRCLQSACS